jgi:hypothetical protein
LVNLETIAFWKKKEPSKAPERIIPLPNLSAPSLESPPVTPIDDVNRAREELKVLKLERQILGSAVTTIYESHSKGVISEAERDRMLEKYKVDLKRLEKGIEENQQIVDLHDLEVEREELIRNFQTKLGEIDAKLKGLKTGAPAPIKTPETTPTDQAQESKSSSNPQTIADSEKRIEQIREEILKAMDRLEQIETEE